MHARAVALISAVLLASCWPAGADAADSSASDAATPTHEQHRTFYIRGDVGIASYDLGAIGGADVVENGGSFISQSFGDAPFIGAGAGWQLSKHLRVDFTGEYRAKTDVKATDYLEETRTAPDVFIIASTAYSGEHSAFVGLANVYLDLFTVHGITPYVGAGIGFAHNRFSGFTGLSTGSSEDLLTGDIRNQTTNSVAGDSSKTTFAWALMAGASLDISEHAKLDLGYRYLNLGSEIAATTGIIDCVCGSVGSPLTASDLGSHEFRIGIRFELDRRDSLPHEPLK